MNGGEGSDFIKDICSALVVVPSRLPSIIIMCIKYVCKIIYNRFNDNPSQVVPIDYDPDEEDDAPIDYNDDENANSLSMYNIGLGSTFNNNRGKAFVIYKAAEEGTLKDLKDAISQVKDKSILKSILDIDFFVSRKRSMRYLTSLMVACERNNPEIVKALIEAGADVNKQSNAEKYENAVTSDYLRHRRWNRADLDKITALYIASEYGHKDVAEVLLAANANPDLATTDGETPLYIASYYRHQPVVEALLKAGADVNKAKKDGRTAIFYAVEDGNIEMVEALLQHGADVYARPIDDRYSPIFKAKENFRFAAQRNNQLRQEESTKMVKLLETYGQRNTTLLLMDPKEGVGVLQDLKVAHDLNASTIEDFYDYLGPDPSRSLRNAKREKILEKKREEGKQKLRNMSHKEREEEEEEAKKRREILSKRVKKDDDDGTPGGKNSRSKTRKQKRRKTKK